MINRFVLGATILFSKLPMWFLYRISDAGFLFIFYIARYRRKVVRSNLASSFPSFDAPKLEQIERRFYRHFCDVIVETLKSFSMSDQELQSRVKLRKPEIVDQMIRDDQGMLLLASHYGNFEWMCARLDLMCQNRIPTFAIYNPFSSQLFEDLITYMRERRGLKMFPMKHGMIQAVRQLQSFCLFGFIFDQAPHRGNRLLFTSFLNQPTAFHTSVAKIALRTKAPIYYADVRKPKRGQYEVELVRFETENFLPENQENIHIYTDFQAQQLAKTIHRNPSFWLWTHRRWKYEPREGDYLFPSLVQDT
ncbi:MAG: lysophospholipid acyltransferase family protein [Bacteroidota bacterium]